MWWDFSDVKGLTEIAYFFINCFYTVWKERANRVGAGISLLNFLKYKNADKWDNTTQIFGETRYLVVGFTDELKTSRRQPPLYKQKPQAQTSLFTNAFFSLP